jgi:hypothetical protein
MKIKSVKWSNKWTKTIKSIKSVGRHKVYDISVKDAEHYVL